MNRVVLVSGHYLRSRRQAGFHWIARSFRDMGADVLFMTAPISWLSWLRRDHRFQYPVRKEANRLLEIEPKLHSFVLMTAWHPANLRSGVLNRLAGPMFQRYPQLDLGDAEQRVRDAELVIFESTPALLLYRRFLSLAPGARFVYRVSDDLGMLRNHPCVLAAEAEFAPEFDQISVPCEYLFKRFRHLPSAALHPHGLQKEMFDLPVDSPYDQRWERNVVFVGNHLLDHDFVARASRLFPHWGFHIIGPLHCRDQAPNVIAYGELPFADTVPYLRHADIGLQSLVYVRGAESFSDSLKVIQYTYSKLPIVAPQFIASERRHFFHYAPGDDASIAKALRDAAAFDRSTVDRSGVMSWDQVRDALMGSTSVTSARSRESSVSHHAAC